MEQRHWGVLCCLLRGKGLGITALSWFGEFMELLLGTLGACREGMGPGRAGPTPGKGRKIGSPGPGTAPTGSCWPLIIGFGMSMALV